MSEEKELSWWEKLSLTDWDDLIWRAFKVMGLAATLAIVTLLWMLVIETWSRHF